MLSTVISMIILQKEAILEIICAIVKVFLLNSASGNVWSKNFF